MVHHVVHLLAAIPDPQPAAPAALVTKVNTVLGLVKWISLMAALVVLLSAGGWLFAAERGHGSGLSPQMKSNLGAVAAVLVVVGAASQIVQFLT